MDHSFQQSLGNNISLLRQKASRHSITGVSIAFTAIFIATMLSAYVTSGEISFQSVFNAQKTNMVLWILDAMPFIFAIWGQYVSSMVSSEAGEMIFNQTKDLRKHSTLLEQKAAYEATRPHTTCSEARQNRPRSGHRGPGTFRHFPLFLRPAINPVSVSWRRLRQTRDLYGAEPGSSRTNGSGPRPGLADDPLRSPSTAETSATARYGPGLQRLRSWPESAWRGRSGRPVRSRWCRPCAAGYRGGTRSHDVQWPGHQLG